MTGTWEKGWKYYVGLALFVYSVATFGLAALTPFVFAPAAAATVATSVVISGEVGFWISAALLGKPFVEALKAKIKSVFTRRSAPAQPISHRRHVLGLVLFSLSFVTYYFAMSIPFLGWDKQTELTCIIGVALTGEACFFASLLVLGGYFWERLKGLYRWPGAAAENVSPAEPVAPTDRDGAASFQGVTSPRGD